MELKCTINNATYKIEQGATFTENYNETLDSAVISIVHTQKIEDLKPYDDVFIYDYRYTFVGYRIRGQRNSELSYGEISKIIFLNSSLKRVYITQKFTYNSTINKVIYQTEYKDEDGNTVENFFFKHLLVDSYQETQLRIGNPVYNYYFNLFSETKRLEKVQVPNVSVTANFANPRSCWFYLQQYVKLYSPKIKMVYDTEEQIWSYEQKYRLDPSLEYILDKTTCPEMSWSNPSLRDILSRIFIVKDMIPYVENDVIRGLDITATHGEFQTNNSSCSFIYAGMSSDNYATDGRREYGNAISNDNSARLVEYLGFRTPNNAVMSLSDMVLETRYPIYKINKLYMCYYKKIQVNGQNKYFLCKQDISKFVLQNTVRNVLKTDWKAFDASAIVSTDIDEIVQYKMATVGYDIGSNRISGWGTTYSYPTILWFSNTKSYLENIIYLMGMKFPFGISNRKVFVNDSDVVSSDPNEMNNIVAYNTNSNNVTDKMKCVFFEMDYIAMYNGAVFHSKDNINRDDIVTADNCNSSLTVLETDGLFEKEKMNRLGNKNFQFPTRYDGEDGYWQMQSLNHVLGSIVVDADNSIVYKCEYSIFNQEVKGSFSACYEYVMKNYFTSVWAKYRTYSLMPYGESIVRAENVRELILLSKDNSYYENTELNFDASKMLSAFTESEVNSSLFITYGNKINSAEIIINGNKYLSDINTFVNGYSLCFNARTYDNVSAGDYIDELHSTTVNSWSGITVKDFLTTQLWYSMVNDNEDAFIENINFTFSHVNLDGYFKNGVLLDSPDNVKNYYDFSFKLPKITISVLESNNISGNFNICKDNKEILDMTYQFELVSYDDDIFVTPYVNKLNDLISTRDFVRFESDKEVRTSTINYPVEARIWSHSPWADKQGLGIVLKIPKNFIDGNLYLTYDLFNMSFDTSWYILEYTDHGDHGTYTVNYGASLQLIRLLSASVNAVTIEAKLFVTGYWSAHSSGSENVFSINLSRVTSIGANDDDDCYWYKYTGTPECWNQQVNMYPGIDTRRFVTYNSIIFDPDNYHVVNNFKKLAGDKDPLKLNSSNAHIVTGGFSSDIEITEKIDKNMFVAVSTQPLKQYYVQEDFDFNSVPERKTGGVLAVAGDTYYKKINNTTYLLTKSVKAVEGSVTSVATVPIFVSDYFYPTSLPDGRNVLRVTPENIPNYFASDAKSLQYWWKDKNNRLHLVFGVNIDNLNEFYIYISAFKQRSTKVYNYNHRYIEDVTDYCSMDAYQYSEHKQHYGNGIIHSKIYYINVEDHADTGEVTNVSGYYVI